MLISEAYTGRDLQHMQMLLKQMVSESVSAADALLAINRELSNRMTAPQANPISSVHEKAVCPTCGSLLRPAAPIEGLIRMGCTKCRYSKIISEVK